MSKKIPETHERWCCSVDKDDLVPVGEQMPHTYQCKHCGQKWRKDYHSFEGPAYYARVGEPDPNKVKQSLRKLAIVRVREDANPEEWVEEYREKMKTGRFLFVGPIPNMDGHGAFLSLDDHQTYIDHVESFEEVPEE
jgi:hypothetical protein